MRRAIGVGIQWLRRGYATAIPESLRVILRETFLHADQSYSRGYYNYIDSLQADSYPIMANTIIKLFSPTRVIDVGCGSGGLLGALRVHGKVRCEGIEFSEAGLALCQKRGIDCQFGDLTTPLAIAPLYDLLICFEVAEHLPARYADQLVANLTSGPKRLLFSAATPGQGGHEHVNEQPNEYWIRKCDARGFSYNRLISEEMRGEWTYRGVAHWFANNVMVFERI
jgi:SAM-dependent methyltransferase